jgi:hypothetical protein
MLYLVQGIACSVLIYFVLSEGVLMARILSDLTDLTFCL